MDANQLRMEVEDLIRTAPAKGAMHANLPANLEWLGRVGAVADQLDYTDNVQIFMRSALQSLGGAFSQPAEHEATIRRLLFQLRWRLIQQTQGATSLAVDTGMVFDYFDGIAQVLKTARSDVLFVDPYLDEEFVGRFLPLVDNAAAVRMLCSKYIARLVPAAEAFATQHKRSIEIRSSTTLHDRYAIVDGRLCYQSGASFKDGAKRSPTTLTEIIDASAAVISMYEKIWAASKVELDS